MDLPSSRALRKEFVDLAVVPVASVSDDGYDGVRPVEAEMNRRVRYLFVQIVVSVTHDKKHHEEKTSISRPFDKPPASYEWNWRDKDTFSHDLII